jgi:hypothetical protein
VSTISLAAKANLILRLNDIRVLVWRVGCTRITSIVFEIARAPTTTTSASGSSTAAVATAATAAGAVALALWPLRPVLSLLSLLTRRLERADLDRDASDLERAATGPRRCSNLAKRTAGDPERSRLASAAGALCPKLRSIASQLALRSIALSCSLAASARSTLCVALGRMRAPVLVLAGAMLEASSCGAALRARSVNTAVAATGVPGAAAVLRERELVLETDLEYDRCSLRPLAEVTGWASRFDRLSLTPAVELEGISLAAPHCLHCLFLPN